MTEEKAMPATNKIYRQIREVLLQTRSRAMGAVNAEMIACYWEIGRLIIVEDSRERRGPNTANG